MNKPPHEQTLWYVGIPSAKQRIQRGIPAALVLLISALIAAGCYVAILSWRGLPLL